jgi:hypothetical protein
MCTLLPTTRLVGPQPGLLGSGLGQWPGLMAAGGGPVPDTIAQGRALGVRSLAIVDRAASGQAAAALGHEARGR